VAVRGVAWHHPPVDDPQIRYGDARDLERMIKQHPGEDFWVHENPDGPAPLRFGLGDDPYDPDAPDGIYRGPYVTTLEELAGVESFDNLGDKLAWALALSEPAQGRTLHIRGRRRPWWEQLWLRLLPGKHCRSCGARLHRTDPQGQPSRVWWCPEHGPLENPDDGKWNAENRISYSD